MTGFPGTRIGWDKDEVLLMNWTAGIVFSIKCILNFMKVQGMNVTRRETTAGTSYRVKT